MSKQLVGEREMRLVDDIEAQAMQTLAKELMESEEPRTQSDGELIKRVMEELDIWEKENMTEESRERAIEMFKLRLDGKTYAEIGAIYGVSRQCVEQILCHREPRRRGRNRIETIYPGLGRWVEENFGTLVAFHSFLTTKENSRNSHHTKEKLIGKVKFNINDILKIVKESGMTFEYLFMMSEEEIQKMEGKAK